MPPFTHIRETGRPLELSFEGSSFIKVFWHCFLSWQWMHFETTKLPVWSFVREMDIVHLSQINVCSSPKGLGRSASRAPPNGSSHESWSSILVWKNWKKDGEIYREREGEREIKIVECQRLGRCWGFGRIRSKLLTRLRDWYLFVTK